LHLRSRLLTFAVAQLKCFGLEVRIAVTRAFFIRRGSRSLSI